MLIALGCGIAQADAVQLLLTFEGLQDKEQVLEFYNGGLGSLGSGPGPNFGISFTATADAVIDGDAGGSGNFAFEPSPDTVVGFIGSSMVMNVLAGFTDVSFFYTNIEFPGAVTLYDDLNATGNVLGSMNLPALGTLGGFNGDPLGAYNIWALIAVDFVGVAKSAEFSGTSDELGIDNVTLAIPIPEPSSRALAAFGIANVCAWRWRRRSKAPPTTA